MNARTVSRMLITGVMAMTIGLALVAAIMGHKLPDSFVPQALLSLIGGSILCAVGTFVGLVITVADYICPVPDGPA